MINNIPVMSDIGTMEIDDVFTEFMLFCGNHLGESKDILKLVKKRYKDCDPDFATSEEFSDLIETTKDKIQTDSHRIFVHLKHFLNELKDHKCLRASKGVFADKAESVSQSRKKGIKRPIDNEISETNEQSLKHPRLAGLVDSHAVEEFESSDSENELPNIIRNFAVHKKHTSKRSRSESPSLLQSDQGQNTQQNWRDFKFKKSVMTSIQAAASTFSSRLSQTIFKASKLNARTSGSNSDCGRIGAVSCGSITSSSRTPSPIFQEKIVSDISQCTNCDYDDNKIEQSESGDFFSKQSGGNVEATGSTEISSTTTNLDSDTESKDKHSVTALDDNFPEKTLNFQKKKVKTPADLCQINGFTVEMNISSDEEDNSMDENKDCLNEETIDFTASDSDSNDLLTISSESNKSNKQVNVSSESNKSDKQIKSKFHGSTEHFSKLVNGAQMKDKHLHNGKHSRARHGSAKSQSSVILIETDEETSSDAEEIKPQVKSEPSYSTYQNEVNVLFEDSDDESCLEKVINERVKTVYCDDVNISGTEVKRHEYRRIALTKVDSVEDEEMNNHSCDIEKRDKSFPAILGLISVKKLEEEKLKKQAEEKLKAECRKRPVIVSVSKLDEKTSLKYLGPLASTSSRDKREDRQHKSKSGKGSKRQIQELEELLTQIRDKIEEVREHELGFDELDDEASDYILEDKLKKKFVAVFKKLCQLHKAEATTGRPTEKFFRYEGTRYPEINRKITRFINKRQEFPDYQDIRKLIVRTNKSKGLNLRRKQIDELSREAFTDVGNRLQRRRHEDFMSTFTTPFAAPVSEYDDPALLDPVLKKKLDANKKDAKSRMDAVVEKYTQLQHRIGDRDLSDDDSEASNNDHNALEKPTVRKPEEPDPVIDEPELIEEEPDLILIEDEDPVAKQGLGFVSRSGRAPLLIESSQLEIDDDSKQAIEMVNDEEEDIGPYFEETQVDDVGSPVPGTSSNSEARPRSWVYDNETLVVSEDESLTQVKSEEESENESTLSPGVLAVFNEGDEIEMVTDNSDSEEETERGIDLQKITDIKIKGENKDDKLVDATNMKDSDPSDTSGLATHFSSDVKRTCALDNDEKAVKNSSQPSHVQNLSNERGKAGDSCSPNLLVTAKAEKEVDRLAEFIDKDLIDLAKQVTEKQHNSDSDSDVEIKRVENIIKSDKTSSKNTNHKVANECNVQNSTFSSKTETAGEMKKLQPDCVLADKMKTNSAFPSVAADLAKEGSATSNDRILLGSQPLKSLSVDKGKTAIDKSAAVSTGSLNFNVQKVKQFVGVLENHKSKNVSERHESSETVRTTPGTNLGAVDISEPGRITDNPNQTAKFTETQTSENQGKSNTVMVNVNNEKVETTNRNSVDNTRRVVEVTCLDMENTERFRFDRSESPSCISIDSTEDIPIPDCNLKLNVTEKDKISGNTSSQSSVKIVLPPKDNDLAKSLVHAKNKIQTKGRDNMYAKTSVQTEVKDNMHAKSSVQTKGIMHAKDSVQTKNEVNKNTHTQLKINLHTKDTVDTAEDNDSDIEIIEEYNINDEYYDVEAQEGEYYPEDNQASYFDDNSSKKDSQGSCFDDNSSKNLNYTEGSYSYEESGLEWEEEEEYPLDSTSYPYANEDTGHYGAYDEEITSTFGDPADFKAPKKITKEQFRAACVSLKKPEGRKPTTSHRRSVKREESLDLIEIYDEPDSTPYEDEMEVSSSCQNELIVLSDSE